MSNHVHEIIFFHNSQSMLCGQLHQYLKTQNIPALYFNVNSKEVAKKLKSGKYFKVTKVPTLVVSFKDGNVKKFEGKECFQWLEHATSSSRQQQSEEAYSSDEEDEMLGSDSEDDIPSEDAEFLEDLNQKSNIPRGRIMADGDKIDVSAVAQRADQERSELEEDMNPKLRKRRG